LAEQAYAYVTLIPVAKGFQSKIASEMSGIGGVGGSVGKKFSQGFGGALKGLVGPAIAAFSAVGITNFAKSAVAAASQFEAEFEGVNQIFGSAAKSVQDFAKNTAFSAGIAETAALQSAKNFGGFALAAGLAGEQAAKFSTDLVQAAGDMASFNDVPVEQALNAIQSGLAGQAMPLRQFGIFLDEATLAAQAAEMGFTGAFASLSQGEKAVVRQASIMAQLGVQAGDFEAYSDTYGNALKTIQARFQEMTSTVGAALLPALAELIPAFLPIVDRIGPILVKIFEAFIPLIEGVTKSLAPLLDAMIPLFDVFALVAEAVGELASTILPPLVEIFAAVTPVVLAVAKAFMPLIKAILPPLVSLIEALLPFIELVATWLGDYWIPLLGKLAEAVMPAVVYVIDLFARALQDIYAILGPVFAALKPVLDALLQFAGIPVNSLKKEIVITSSMDAETRRMMALGPQVATGIVPTTITPPTGGAGGKGSADAAKKAQAVVKKTTEAIKGAQKKYNQAVKKANRDFAERSAEISENYSIAVAKATIDRDKSLAKALEDNAKRVAGIKADFAKRLDDIIKTSMNRLRDVYRSAVEINVAQIFDGNVVAGSIDGTIELMRRKLTASRRLLANAAALAAAGFSQTFIEQVVGAGTEVGNELAEGILNATPEQQAEMRNLFNAIEVEASNGMDALSQTIFEKNGLATQELKNLYANTQAELITALADQEATYQQTMADIMTRFDEAVVEAALTRDKALEQADKKLREALVKANENFLADLRKIKKAFKDQISEMQGMVASMSASISNLMSQISAAQSAAQTAKSAAASIPTSTKKAKLATGGLVTGPTNALIGEAGPELVIPLDKFESWMNMGQGSGKAINYYAAPNLSLDSEQELFQAMKRAKVVVGW
jgi:phage-related protein